MPFLGVAEAVVVVGGVVGAVKSEIGVIVVARVVEGECESWRSEDWIECTLFHGERSGEVVEGFPFGGGHRLRGLLDRRIQDVRPEA